MHTDSITVLQQLLERYEPGSGVISNCSALPAAQTARPLQVLWMYPDSLSLHGGRGDLMALLRFATAAGIPLTIRRVEQPRDEIPLEEADLLYFCAGDLRSVPYILKALEPQRQALQDYAAAGGCIFANGSSGALLAKKLCLKDGSSAQGLGLLDMEWQETGRVQGDDLWLCTEDGMELIGNQIALAEITLGEGQKPFASVHYGHGNNGSGAEGAVTGNVIYSACLGPVLVRNPWLAARLLKLAAVQAGLLPENAELSIGEIPLERRADQDARCFIEGKMKGRS